jgi:hypothetical protein
VSRRRIFLLVGAGLLLLAVIDFWQRIYVPSATRARGEGSFQPAAVPAPLSAARIQKDLVSWLPTLQPVSGGGDTGAESDVSLTLLAVFVERDASFAVVRAASTAGGGTRIQSVAPGDKFYGLTVIRVEPRSVVLQGASGEQELAIFTPDTVAVAASGEGAAGLSAPAPASTAARAAPATPVQPAPGGATQQKSVEWKDGKPAQLPESMRGLKFVEAPATPLDPKAGPTSSEPPQPQKP